MDNFFFGTMLLSVCTASLTPHMKYLHSTLTSSRFAYDRPNSLWKANQTAAAECGSLMFCSAGKESAPFPFSMEEDLETSTNTVVSNVSLNVVIPPDPMVLLKPVTSLWRNNNSPVSPVPVNISLYFQPMCSVPSHTFPKRTKLPTTRKISKFVAAPSHQHHGNSSLTCQQGCSKSLGLKIELCSMRYAGNDRKMPLLTCLEYYGPTLVNAKYCTSVYNVSWKPVQRCLARYQDQRKMVDVAGLLAPHRKNLPPLAANGKTKKKSSKSVIGRMFAGNKFIIS